jgi:hypothetical protein
MQIIGDNPYGYNKITSRDVLEHLERIKEKSNIQDLFEVYEKQYNSVIKNFEELENIQQEHTFIINKNFLIFKDIITKVYNKPIIKSKILYIEKQIEEYQQMYSELEIFNIQNEYNILQQSFISLYIIKNIIDIMSKKLMILDLMKKKLYHIFNSKIEMYKFILHHIYNNTHTWKFVIKNLIGFTSSKEINYKYLLDIHYDKYKNILKL